MLQLMLLYFTHYAQYYAKLAPDFAPSWHGYYITNKDCYIKKDEHNVYKLTDNDFQ